LIEAGPRILLALPERLAAATADLLRRLNITIRTGTPVTSVNADGVTLQSGEFVPAELIVWAAGIKAPEFLRDLDGLETDKLNRLIVRPTLQTLSDDNIFAIGDCANCVPEGSDKPLPPRAQTAQQQADFMVKAVKSRLNGKAVPSFRFHDRGSLVALSDYKTFGVIFGGFRLEGLIAKLAYRSLHQQHLLALYGFGKFILLSLAALISRRAEPRIKLH
jgi:NADH dehydrogenase